ncbi:hypothetical protein AAFF_G00274140 [Aldrovandia affinis]|uniref:E3 ubiquitin-protein ligase Topors n=1 Tax=Aldrovandia affinis TaxID=143900 RepID=A0AAD7SSW0_9TELE|nr:hypothetical protein AAFF_G00274140 [Aldrovandia affinis]
MIFIHFFTKMMMEPTRMRLRTRKKPGSGKATQPLAEEASPDSKCPICLDRFNNMAYLDRCLHKFCFRCIHEWSKNKAECPLCKQGFNSIFHTIKAENDFKEFVLRPTENGSFGSPGGHRFRYRTTLTRERRQARRRTSSPPDNGVIFEGLAGDAPPQPDRGMRHMMNRLAARNRAQSEGRTLRTLREQEMVNFRRALYRTGVRIRSVRDGGRCRDTSAEFYQRNPACLHRLVPWLKRELTVLYGAHGSLVNIVQHIIMSWITRYDMEDQAMQEELRPFLLARTDHFLHEFISFARAPFNMEAYDQHAVYDCPAPSSLEDSSSDASVIAILEDEELDPLLGSAAGSALSQAPWDDETPGPSYSTMEQAPLSLAVSESESESSSTEGQLGAIFQQSAQVKTDPPACKGGAPSSGEEDCVIVGYVKPMAERTPELVQLSSDSEESVHSESTEALPQPRHIRFPSLSPPSSTGSPPSNHEADVVQADPCEGSEVKDSAVPGDAPCWGSPPPDKHGTSDEKKVKRRHVDRRAHDQRHRKRDGSRERQRSKSKEEQALDRTRRQSRSTDRSWSARSPTISINSDSTLSRGRGRSRSRSRDHWLLKSGAREDRQARDGSGREKCSYSYSYQRDSHGHYSRERESGCTTYSQSRSHYAGEHGNPDPWTLSCSWSRTPTRPHRRDRRHTRSPSSASSQGSRSAHRRSRHDKPGGKRKYKTRHLEDTSRGRSPGPLAPPPPPAPQAKEKTAGGERRRRKSRRKSRSPSVEIVFEGKGTGESRRRHKKKKKHKKKKDRKRKSREPAEQRSPTIITINSDSDPGADADADALDLRCSASGDGASTTAGSPSGARLLESILQDWEGQIPSVEGSSVDIFKAGSAFTADDFDDAQCDVPQGTSEQTPISPKDENSTSSPPKIHTESHLLSCL